MNFFLIVLKFLKKLILVLISIYISCYFSKISTTYTTYEQHLEQQPFTELPTDSLREGKDFSCLLIVAIIGKLTLN